MAKLNRISGNKPRKESLLKDDNDENNNGSILAKRISIVKMNKTTHVESKNLLRVFNKKSV